MRIKETMERNVDSTGWTIFGATIGVMSTWQGLEQIGIAAASAVVTYVAVHFAKLLLHKYAPIKKSGE